MEVYLRNNTQINYFGEGSIAKSIVAIASNSIEMYYNDLDFNMRMAFVSTAQGHFLDLIGELIDCQRLSNESDNNYRYRIIHQVYVIPGSSETALRIHCMNIDNVRDVILRPHVRGAGTFDIHVDVVDRNKEQETLEEVRKIIHNHMAFGLAGNITLPVYLLVKMAMHITFKREISMSQKRSIASECRQAVRNYIDNLNVGPQFSANQVIFHILAVNPDLIQSVNVTEFIIDERPVAFIGHQLRWNEKLIPGEIEVFV